MIVFDTDVLSELMRARPSPVLLAKLEGTPVGEQATTSITLGEIAYGALRLADPDLRIAAIVTAHQATLVTGNVRHFTRVPGLVAEDWLRG